MLCWTHEIFSEWLENLIFIWVLYFSLIGLPYPIQGMKSVESKLSHRLYFPVNWCFSKCGEKTLTWFVLSGHNSYPQTQTLSFLDLICLCIVILIIVKCMWKKIIWMKFRRKKNHMQECILWDTTWNVGYNVKTPSIC